MTRDEIPEDENARYDFRQFSFALNAKLFYDATRFSAARNT
jgi:hypothetical protein